MDGALFIRSRLGGINFGSFSIQITLSKTASVLVWWAGMILQGSMGCACKFSLSLQAEHGNS